MDYDDEKEKLSWSEIDKLKNRSRHVSREKPAYKQSKRSQWAKHQYLKEAEKLFKGKKGIIRENIWLEQSVIIFPDTSGILPIDAIKENSFSNFQKIVTGIYIGCIRPGSAMV